MAVSELQVGEFLAALGERTPAPASGAAAAVTGAFAASLVELAARIAKNEAAVTRAKILDRDKIRDAIAATKMMTVVGPVRFRADGTGEVKVFFQQWLKGKQELVWPKEFATAPFGYPAPPFDKR